MRTRRLFIAFALSLGGCVSSAPPQALPPNHPANPDAPEAALAAPSQTLAAAQPSSMPSTDESMPAMAGMQHDGMQGMSHDMPGMTHAKPSSQPTSTQAATVYTCKMHPEIISDKPGKCPKCNMKLVPKKDADASELGGTHE